MIDFDKMVQNEDMADVILFLVSRGENGMAYPSIDRFFGRHKAAEKYESYNTELIHELKNLRMRGKFSHPELMGLDAKKGLTGKHQLS
ncbi:hypothetical protein [Pantoea agglomerans]|uniref:hypothetical protein n=1 Tax=Enterobacter agglomerans TaxID=549 RepID=UPI003BF4F1A5